MPPMNHSEMRTPFTDCMDRRSPWDGEKKKLKINTFSVFFKKKKSTLRSVHRGRRPESVRFGPGIATVGDLNTPARGLFIIIDHPRDRHSSRKTERRLIQNGERNEAADSTLLRRNDVRIHVRTEHVSPLWVRRRQYYNVQWVSIVENLSMTLLKSRFPVTVVDRNTLLRFAGDLHASYCDYSEIQWQSGINRRNYERLATIILLRS